MRGPRQPLKVQLAQRPSSASSQAPPPNIRSGHLPGHYNDTLGSMGWVTTRAAVTAYKQRLQVTR
jgi:hypothetical protein